MSPLSSRAAATSFLASPPGGAILGAAVPLVFLAARYQPSITVGGVSATLTDAAILAVAALAVLRGGYGALAPARRLWLAAAVFLLYVFAACAYPLARDPEYAAAAHLVSAGKFAEYALLAPAAALLLRTRRDLSLLLAAVVGWSVVCTGIALAQYAGAHVLGAWPAGGRQPSLLGIHELAAFSAATAAAGLALLAVGGGRRLLVVVAAVSGGAGLVLSGAAAGGVGVGVAVAAVALVARLRGTLTRRGTVAGAAVLVLAAAGLLAMRSGDIGQFARFAGVSPEPAAEASGGVQTYAQRTLMLDLGYRLWLDRPLLGHGWQSVREPHVFEPHLPGLHARFPDQPELAFPSRAHPWGIDNAYVQALAELGALGLAAFVAFLAAAVLRGGSAALRAQPAGALAATVGVAWVLVAAGVWTGQPLVAGTSIDAVAWLGVGLAAAAVAGGARERP